VAIAATLRSGETVNLPLVDCAPVAEPDERRVKIGLTRGG
jgi:hypothetical protein